MVPGKIVQIKGDTVTLQYGEEQRQATLVEGTYKEGDYVLVQGGIVLEKIDKEEAEESLAFYVEATSNNL